MKKFLVFLSALCLFSVTIASAQKIDAEGILKKIEKNDAAVADEKKSKKAAVWVERGDLYYRAANEPIKSIYLGGSSSMLEMSYGEGKSGKMTVNNREFSTLDYPYLKVFLDGTKVVAWRMKKYIKENTLDTAVEAYLTAFELDFQTNPKVQAGLNSILNYYRQMGNVHNSLNEPALGAEAFTKANDIQKLAIYEAEFDASLTFYAGYMHVMNTRVDSASFPLAEMLLSEAVEANYCDLEDADEGVAESSRGDIFYYMFYCAYAQKEADSLKVLDAKRYLKDGIARYPRNENIFDGLLQLYTSEEGLGDPTELLGTAEESVKLDPKNVNAWYGIGRIYYAVKDYDKALEAFEHVIEIDPKMHMAHFYMGLFKMHQADAVYNEIKDNSYTDRAKYNEDMARLNGAYALSIPYFEQAYELKPTDLGTVSYLKQLCFRLRDDPEMMEKYTKYNEVYDSLLGK